MDMLGRLIGEFVVLIYLSLVCLILCVCVFYGVEFLCFVLEFWIFGSLHGCLCLTCHMWVPNSILWWPSGRNDKLISIDEENLFLWSLDCSRKAAQVEVVLDI